MSDKLEKAELEELIRLPAFRKFLFRTSIQSAGLLDYNAVKANGSDGRNLEYHEGRRSLGFEALRDAARGIPGVDGDPALWVLFDQVLREGIQSTPQEKPRAKSDRYAETDDEPES